MKTWKIIVCSKEFTKCQDMEKNQIEVIVEAPTWRGAETKANKKYRFVGLDAPYFRIGGTQQIRTIDEKLTKENSIVCQRCGGTGYIPKFIQYHSGICYACDGVGRLRITKKDGD